MTAPVTARVRWWFLIAGLAALAGCGVSHVRTPSRPTASRASQEPAAANAPAAPSQIQALRLQGWRTDFTKHAVSLTEFQDGGPPRDGIPPIDDPKPVALASGDRFLTPHEPVIAVQVGGQARAYPEQILVWHEIVNDDLGGIPIAVSYCPLCNSAIVFDRHVGAQTLTFGTTGKLRNSDLVMWDRQTQSWWQQFTGTAPSAPTRVRDCERSTVRC